MPPVTFAPRSLVFILAADDLFMNMHDDTEAIAAEPVTALDPGRVLECVVSELEYLGQDAPLGSGSDLIELHGALLAYNLEGRPELVPTPSFGLSLRAWRERRVVRSARQIIARGAGDATVALDVAAGVIARHLHLIDPELCTRAA